MIYAKNVPVIERGVRVLVGVGCAVGGVIELRGLSPLWGWALIAAGIVAALTGFIGFCPMCALAGRRIQQNLSQRSSGTGGGRGDETR